MQRTHELIQETMAALYEICEENGLDGDEQMEAMAEQVVAQVAPGESFPEWIRAVFECEEFDQLCTDWDEYSERDVTVDDLERVLHQLQAFVADLEQNS
mgnify:CR=1 FL=1